MKAFEVIKSPWEARFFDLVKSSVNSIKIAAPFIKQNTCEKLLATKPEACRIELVTSFVVKNIHSGALDLGALERVLNSNGTIRSFPRLHAKIYVFDDKQVVITSGNLTDGGLTTNYEYGLYSSSQPIVESVVEDFSKLQNDERGDSINHFQIQEVREYLRSLPPLPIVQYPTLSPSVEQELDSDILITGSNSIEGNLRGWRLHIFQRVNQLPHQQFSLADMGRFVNELKQLHPDNQNIEAKIRQQLQELRDLGLIEFSGGGRYRKLWK